MAKVEPKGNGLMKSKPSASPSQNVSNGNMALKGRDRGRPMDKSKEAPRAGEGHDDIKDALLKVFRADLENLRSKATCTICFKLLYEPYTLKCGHTFCYSCLCQWFQEHRKNMTCPECREEIREKPAPAYLVRDMVEIFIERVQLMSAGESPEQHRKARKEESSYVERDKADTDAKTGGLFRGCFNSGFLLRAIRDTEDGVDRCPSCSWELEHGYCRMCGISFDEDGRIIMGSGAFEGGFSDLEDDEIDDGLSDEDWDEELDMDGLGAFRPMPGPLVDDQDAIEDIHRLRREMGRRPVRRPSRPAAHSAAGGRVRRHTLSSTSDMLSSEDGDMGTLDEESDEEETESMRDFIDDGASDRPRSDRLRSIRSSVTPGPPPRHQGSGRPSSGELGNQSRRGSATDEDDYDEGGAVSNGRRRRPGQRASPPERPGRRAPIVLSSSSEADDEECDQEDTEALLQPGWTPLHQDIPEDELESDPDEDDEPVQGGVVVRETERARLGGSITPTADRPNPASPTRTRARPSRRGGLPRGLRRISSSISTSTATYEDGEADDDDSDEGSVTLDRDGDVEMGESIRRAGVSRHPQATIGGVRPDRFAIPRSSLGDSADLDADSPSEASARPPRGRGQPRQRQQDYDPRISMMFAQHQMDMRDINQYAAVGLDHLESLARARTPTQAAFTIPRPRTANRNRYPHPSMAGFSPAAYATPSPSSFMAAPFSPSAATASSRNSIPSTPTREFPSDNSPARITQSVPEPSPSSRSAASSGRPSPARQASSGAGEGQWQRSPIQTPSSPTSHQGSVFSNQHGVAHRPGRDEASFPGEPGNRNSAHDGQASASSFPVIQPAGRLPSGAPGINYARSLQANPYANYFLRPRPSSRSLREAPSNATLRARPSRRELHGQASQAGTREASAPLSAERPHASRNTLRAAPSQQRLRSQGSTQTLRYANAGGASQATSLSGGGIAAAARSRAVNEHNPSPGLLSEDERRRRGSEIVRQRREALMGRNAGEAARPAAPLTAQTASVNHGEGRQHQPARPQNVSSPIRQNTASAVGTAVHGAGTRTATGEVTSNLEAARDTRGVGTPSTSATRSSTQPSDSRAAGRPLRTRTGPVLGNGNVGAGSSSTAVSRGQAMAAGGEGRE
ncbi:MAG: hypothetical protein M1832_003260 [Thelocarpon impressellum]|nr:MAG: hypothetical protein M1832_003260 [Thelocarpon impressellum]